MIPLHLTKVPPGSPGLRIQVSVWGPPWPSCFLEWITLKTHEIKIFSIAHCQRDISLMAQKLVQSNEGILLLRERSGSVVECLTRD